MNFFRQIETELSPIRFSAIIFEEEFDGGLEGGKSKGGKENDHKEQIPKRLFHDTVVFLQRKRKS